MATPLRLRAATRGSALARWQTNRVAELLAATWPGTEVDVLVVETTGDVRSDEPISAMGGKGVFAKEVQAAVLEGRADLAVHSAKDLPSVTLAGLALAAVPERADPRDALIGSTLADLRPSATVATGSIRRRAQLGHLRPDLRFAELRGNVPTRVQKADSFDAIVLAAAGLDRLGLNPEVMERLGVDVLLPQVGQGALAVECRSEDARLLEVLAAIEDLPSRRTVDAERAFLAELGGDCDLPAAGYAVATDAGVELEALIAAPDGSVVLRERGGGPDPTTVGSALAGVLLDERGGRDLLGSA